jgi:A/G-specific adenine glycosylase
MSDASDVLDQLNSAWFTSFRRSLNRWYEANARDLPWRRTHDAYRIWISEIMLQQTTVVAVIPYFERFLKRFPTVKKLATADEQDVLRLWEGLGYYSRARNIHKTAKLIVSDYDGAFPPTADELQKLPGIGRYTAGAIASFAFDTPAPIVEANTLRLYCRLLGYAGDPRSKAGQSLLWNFAERLLPRKQPGRLNQALMELGGTLCSVKEPNCTTCPVRTKCRSFADGNQAQIPRPKTRPTITQLTHVNVIVRKGSKLLIRQHTDDERWSGLWDFPRYELTKDLADLLPTKITSASVPPSLFAVEPELSQFLRSEVKQQTGIETEVGEPFHELSHAVTRYKIRLVCFNATAIGGRPGTGAPTKWAGVSELAEFPLSMTARKIAKRLADS